MEELEPRLLLSVGYTPFQIRHAYGFDRAPLNGAGQTSAIVDAGDAPNLAADLSTFDRAFNLPPVQLTQVNQYGGPVGGDDLDGLLGWSLESSLDVEWVHSIAPVARIVWVEALSASPADLMTAVHFAATYPGVSVVSMSFGGPENASFRQFDSVFTLPVGFVASSGDNGPGVSYPSSNPHVLAVGGTTLHLDLAAKGERMGGNETPWSGSGGGQSGLYRGRTTPDVAFDADPATGVQVYYTSPNIIANPGWLTVGGTSVGAPCWAGLTALADQSLGHVITDLPSYIHGLPVSDFNFIGGLTGRGSPVTNLIADAADSAYVTGIYESILGRQPDQDGFTNWMDALQTNRLSRERVFQGIGRSHEAETIIIESLYAGLLHRRADAGGLEHWLEVMDSEGVAAVIDGITNSVEYIQEHT